MFFVLGLPRSRTAWLANFLTYGDSFCYHEGLDGCSTVQEYKQKIQGCGDSSTGLYLLDINKEFPDTKRIIIEPDSKDIERAKKFTETYFPQVPKEWVEYLYYKLMQVDGPRVPFKEINNNLEFIWTYLIPDKPFNKKRADQLMNMNVQVQNVYNYNTVSAKKFLDSIGV